MKSLPQFSSMLSLVVSVLTSSLAFAQAPCCTEHTPAAAPAPTAAQVEASKWRPVWQTETRERRTTVMKPVQKTYDRIEKSTVLKPVTETKYRERKIEETSYEVVTEMREERRVVQRPVVETEMREQEVPVRKKITETMTRTENVTQYKPVTVNQTQLVPGAPAVVDTGASAFRPQLQWLRRGYYNDPQTGLNTFRRPGLHWVQPPTTALVPTVVPQTVATTTLVPEVVQKSEPVEVTRYVDTVERRKVPVEVKRMVEEVQVRKVPVTVRRPKTVTRVEKIPYQETRYVEQIVTKRTPVTETTYEPVTKVEPYQEQTCRWVRYDEMTDKTETAKPAQEQQTEPRESVHRATTRAQQPIQTQSVLETLNEQGPEPTHNDVSNTATRDHEAAQRDAATQAGATLLETSERRPITKVQRIDYSDVPVIRRPSELYQPNRPGTINVPATQPSLDRTRTELARINPKGSVFETEPRTNADIDWSAPPAKLP